MFNHMNLKTGVMVLFVSVLLILPNFAQQGLTQPRASQQASVSQRVGLTDITIDYHRPGVKGREVWGKLVPYNEVWRAGANENTTISFSTKVNINGKEVPAGKYGLHMIPTEKNWTIILSRDNAAWGSFFYDESRDQLRFTTTPEATDFQEWLGYSFDDISPNSTTVALRWGNLSIPFTIDVEVKELVAKNMKEQLTGLAGFGWQGWNQIANYYMINDMDMKQALGFAERSMQINKNVTNSFTKAVILESLGKSGEADKLKQEAFATANENEINTLGYQFLFAGKIDNAMEIFKKNVEMHPDSWNVYDSLGECYAAAKDNKNAVEYYSKALEKAPENQKKRIMGTIDNLKGS
jgi:tetratricopeptide (TPR) repeat protein